jgi:hypothetical protein
MQIVPVFSTDFLAHAHRDPASAAAEAGLTPETLHRLVTGAQGTALASCTDHQASPHAQLGDPCPASFLDCLDCGNARALPHHLPVQVSIGRPTSSPPSQAPSTGCSTVNGCSQPTPPTKYTDDDDASRDRRHPRWRAQLGGAADHGRGHQGRDRSEQRTLDGLPGTRTARHPAASGVVSTCPMSRPASSTARLRRPRPEASRCAQTCDPRPSAAAAASAGLDRRQGFGSGHSPPTTPHARASRRRVRMTL